MTENVESTLSKEPRPEPAYISLEEIHAAFKEVFPNEQLRQVNANYTPERAILNLFSVNVNDGPKSRTYEWRRGDNFVETLRKLVTADNVFAD